MNSVNSYQVSQFNSRAPDCEAQDHAHSLAQAPLTSTQHTPCSGS